MAMKCLTRTRTTALVAALICLPFAAHSAPRPQPNSQPSPQPGPQSSQDKQLPSPPAVAETKLNGKALVIHYNAPSVRGRKIMGGLVPYGQVWRTGANPATSFTTEVDLTLGTLHVPAGKYTIYTLPAAPGTPWMLIVNKETGQWGTVYHGAQDLGRTPMHEGQLPSPQEVMSLSFEKTSGSSTQLHMRWEKADEWVEVKLAR